MRTYVTLPHVARLKKNDVWDLGITRSRFLFLANICSSRVRADVAMVA